LPTTHRNNRGVASFVDIQAVVSGTQCSESQIWRINLDRLILTKVAHMNVYGTFGELNLRHGVIEVQKRKACLASKTNHG
jgi:hypothetical protein